MKKNRHSHYCYDWDEMFVCAGSEEMECCTCAVPENIPTAAQVKELRELTGAGMQICKEALEMRDCDMEYAKEYVERHNLAVSMGFMLRYPKWASYVYKMNTFNKA